MSDQREFSDEDLTAFLDGEAGAALSADIRRASAADAALAIRLNALDLDTRTIKNSFDSMLGDAPEMPEPVKQALSKTVHGTVRTTPTVAAGRGGFRVSAILKSIAATALICLVLGGAGGYWLSGARSESWHEAAAIYHALYVNKTLASVNRLPSETSKELDRVSSALGKSLKLAVLSSDERLDYKRAQILGFKGRRLIQLAFLSTAGTPVALCITPIISNPGTSKAVRVVGMHGMKAATWSKDGYEYLLVGGTDAGLIERAARKFADQI